MPSMWGGYGYVEEHVERQRRPGVGQGKGRGVTKPALKRRKRGRR